MIIQQKMFCQTCRDRNQNQSINTWQNVFHTDCLNWAWRRWIDDNHPPSLQSCSQPVSRPVNRSTSQSVSQPVNRPTSQSVSQLQWKNGMTNANPDRTLTCTSTGYAQSLGRFINQISVRTGQEITLRPETAKLNRNRHWTWGIRSLAAVGTERTVTV